VTAPLPSRRDLDFILYEVLDTAEGRRLTKRNRPSTADACVFTAI